MTLEKECEHYIKVGERCIIDNHHCYYNGREFCPIYSHFNKIQKEPRELKSREEFEPPNPLWERL